MKAWIDYDLRSPVSTLVSSIKEKVQKLRPHKYKCAEGNDSFFTRGLEAHVAKHERI